MLATSDNFSDKQLYVYAGSQQVADLRLAGSYTTSDFVLSHSDGNTLITLKA